MFDRRVGQRLQRFQLIVRLPISELKKKISLPLLCSKVVPGHIDEAVSFKTKYMIMKCLLGAIVE